MNYSVAVKKAVADPEWQKFRKSLKGLTTIAKLEELCDYYMENMDRSKHAGLEPCGPLRSEDWCVVCVRVDNYIKALCRGGQLYPGESLWTVFEKQFHFGTKIKR